MDITTHEAGEFLEVTVKGRLDGSWTTHFTSTLDEIVRQGHHRLRVNLRGVTYISSMGIGVLVECYKNLIAIEGVLVVSDPSPVVRKVLDMVDLSATLMAEPPRKTRTASVASEATVLEQDEARFEVYGLDGDGVRVRVLGDPAQLEGCRFGPSHCQPVTFGADAFGIGLGAFGGGFQDCQNRFGEFLAVAGAAAYQPADGSNAADYMLGSTTSFPEVQLLYGVAAKGTFSRMARFEAAPDAGAVTLTGLADAGLAIAESESAWMALVAESAGLAGVTLRRAPVNGTPETALFRHPEVRTWLSFTTERAHVRALTLVTGVVTKASVNDLKAVTRPLSRGATTHGHLHAAAFSYRPLQKGLIEIDDTVRSLFEREDLLGILHLIGDDRESERVWESEFVRGAMWVAPITAIEPAKESP